MCTTIHELTAVISDYRSMKALQKETEKILKDLENEILAYMDQTGKTSETGPDYTVQITDCSRDSLDKAALQVLLGDSIRDYMKHTSYRRLTVK